MFFGSCWINLSSCLTVWFISIWRCYEPVLKSWKLLCVILKFCAWLDFWRSKQWFFVRVIAKGSGLFKSSNRFRNFHNFIRTSWVASSASVVETKIRFENRNILFLIAFTKLKSSFSLIIYTTTLKTNQSPKCYKLKIILVW